MMMMAMGGIGLTSSPWKVLLPSSRKPQLQQQQKQGPKSCFPLLRIRAISVLPKDPGGGGGGAGGGQGGKRSRGRLLDLLAAIPSASRGYFRSPLRRALYGGIAILGGFYIAQTISLSFGALGVNDVIASVLCVLLAEYVTRLYYSRPRPTFALALVNNFKLGFTYGLFIDAFKLSS